MGWTMRTDFLEVWRDLVLHGMGDVDFHVSPKWTYEYNQLIFRKMTPKINDFSGNVRKHQKSSFFDKKNWKSIDIHCWTSRYSLLDIRYSLMNLGFIDESWIHWWILIFIVGHPIFIVGHPILMFCPRNPKAYFSWKIQKDARRKMIEIRLFKS